MTVSCNYHINIMLNIKKRIFGSGKGAVFTSSDFLDLGGRAAVDKALSRMTAAGHLRRLSHGLYDYPETHPVLGKLFPSLKTVADALSRREVVKLQPAGAYAANLLGLSEQVPAKAVFLTAGQSRTINVGPMKIILRHSSPRNIAAAGRLSGLLIQALRHLGKKHIKSEHIEHLKKNMSAIGRKALIRDIRLAPAWMHGIFRELALMEKAYETNQLS